MYCSVYLFLITEEISMNHHVQLVVLIDVNEILVLEVGHIVKGLVTHPACLVLGFLGAPFNSVSHTCVDNNGRLTHTLSCRGMLAVQQFDP